MFPNGRFLWFHWLWLRHLLAQAKLADLGFDNVLTVRRAELGAKFGGDLATRQSFGNQRRQPLNFGFSPWRWRLPGRSWRLDVVQPKPHAQRLCRAWLTELVLQRVADIRHR